MFKKKFPWAKVTVAFVAGCVVGAATALLLTPMTGKRMQRQLMKTVDEQVETVEKIVKKMVA
ncbi:MAG TPA: YtxH domain-containing protein [Thermoanaerobaculia bacterium]